MIIFSHSITFMSTKDKTVQFIHSTDTVAQFHIHISTLFKNCMDYMINIIIN